MAQSLDQRLISEEVYLKFPVEDNGAYFGILKEKGYITPEGRLKSKILPILSNFKNWKSLFGITINSLIPFKISDINEEGEHVVLTFDEQVYDNLPNPPSYDDLVEKIRSTSSIQYVISELPDEIEFGRKLKENCKFLQNKTLSFKDLEEVLIENPFAVPDDYIRVVYGTNTSSLKVFLDKTESFAVQTSFGEGTYKLASSSAGYPLLVMSSDKKKIVIAFTKPENLQLINLSVAETLEEIDAIVSSDCDAAMFSRVAAQKIIELQKNFKGLQKDYEDAQAVYLDFHRQYKNSLMVITAINQSKELIISGIKSEILDLQKMSSIERYSVDGDQFTFYTRDIYQTVDKIKYYHGKFKVTVNINGGVIRMMNTVFTCNGMNHSMQAPHVFPDGKPCLGDIQKFISTLIGEFRLCELVHTSVNFLESLVKEDGAGKHWKNWPVVNDDGTVDYNDNCKMVTD